MVVQARHSAGVRQFSLWRGRVFRRCATAFELCLRVGDSDRPPSESTAAAAHSCSRSTRAATDSADRKSTPAHVGRQGELLVLRHLLAAIPRQRLPQRRRQLLNPPRQRRHHRRRIGGRDPLQEHKARLPFDQRRDLRPEFAHEQIAFPVPRHRARIRLGRSLGDRHDIHQLARPAPARAFARGRRYAWPRRRCAMRLRLSPPRLDVEGLIDRLVRHLHREVVGKRC